MEELQDPARIRGLYDSGEPLPSGRGTARIIELSGSRYLLKKEARGGMTAKFLPDSFFFLDVFDNEWLIQELADSSGLSLPLLARWEFPGPLLLTEVFTLTAFIEGSLSLKDMIAAGTLDGDRLAEAGKVIAGLHKKGIYHGDLNCGNILFTPDGARIIDFKGSYIFSAPLPEALSKKNLLRLLRSFHKESIKARRNISLPVPKILCEGYMTERNEQWIGEFSRTAKISKLRLMSYKAKSLSGNNTGSKS